MTPPTGSVLAVVALAVAAVAAPARAEPDSQPVADDTGPDSRPVADRDRPDSQPATDNRAPDGNPLHLSGDVPPQSSLSDRIVFRANIGFGLDGGQPSGKPLASGASLTDDYEQLRIYGFGDAVIGTRGLVASSLSSYLASHFRFDQKDDLKTFSTPSLYDSRGVDTLLIRSAYVDVDDFLDEPWMRPVYLRAGRQYHYGPAIIHFDGLVAGYRTRAISASVYAGQRVSMYGFDNSQLTGNGAIAGVDAKVDLTTLSKVPLVLSAGALTFDGRQHYSAGAAAKWHEDTHILARVRGTEGGLGRESLILRTRLSAVTTVSAELSHLTGDGWAYDLLSFEPTHGPTDPRRYLNLGPVRPRVMASVRAGTVFFDNIDALVRAGAAIDTAPEDLPKSSFDQSYAEVGAALEVRVRRTLRIGASVLGRRTSRDDVPAPPDMAGADPLPLGTGVFGERSFYEGGLVLGFSSGPKQLTARAEVYGRAYDFDPIWPGIEPKGIDGRFGGRFSVEAWAGDRLRLFGEYDVAVLPDQRAPELRGAKSLRVLAEARF